MFRLSHSLTDIEELTICYAPATWLSSGREFADPNVAEADRVIVVL